MIKKPEAWCFTGRVTDKGMSGFQCDLCGRISRFSFELRIRGKAGSDRSPAHSGSECAAKVYNSMAEAEGIDKHDWMLKNKTRLYADARSRRLIHLMLSIKKANPDIDIDGLLKTCRSGKRLTPRQAMYFSRLAKRTDTALTSDIVPVALNTIRAQDQVKEMKGWEFDALISLLSPRQYIICQKIRSGSSVEL